MTIEWNDSMIPAKKITRKIKIAQPEQALFECQAHRNYKFYALMMLALYSLAVTLAVTTFNSISDSTMDENMYPIIIVGMIFAYIMWEYITDTIKISDSRYRFTTQNCYIASRYPVNTYITVSYDSIARAEVLKRPWQQWFGLYTICLVENNTSISENPEGEDLIRLVSKADAEKILAIIQAKIHKP
jgi:hypothetical protein